MTGTERALVERALGPVVLRAMDRVAARPDPARWRALALAVTLAAADAIIADRKAAAMVAAIWRRGAPISNPCDARVTGCIGGLDLSEGCFSFTEAWTMAARDLVRTGRAGEAEATLRSGLSVRALLRRFYGVKAGPDWDAEVERRAFLRTLRRARLRFAN
jgi:hypothetical protein